MITEFLKEKIIFPEAIDVENNLEKSKKQTEQMKH